jgi:hypothetical protein
VLNLTPCCGEATHCGFAYVSSPVLDRDTLEQFAEIPIAPDDDDYQDSIGSIAADENRIYVSIEYRYEDEDPDRTNFVVIDKASLEVLKRAHIDAPPSLIMDNGRLLACGCSFTEEQSCMVLDPVTKRADGEPGLVCAMGGTDGDAVTRLPSGPQVPDRFCCDR